MRQHEVGAADVVPDSCASTLDASETVEAQRRAERRAASAAGRKARKLARASTPPPVRDPIYDGHSLTDLRTVRARLVAEETRVSYWRRVIQARLDVAAVGKSGTDTVTDLSRVLTDARGAVTRLAYIDVHPVDDLEPLPNLSELWARQVTPDDPVALSSLVADLEAAEVQLSTHRADVHRRIDLVTAELIARYREQPLLALTILPVNPLYS